MASCGNQTLGSFAKKDYKENSNFSCSENEIMFTQYEGASSLWRFYIFLENRILEYCIQKNKKRKHSEELSNYKELKESIKKIENLYLRQIKVPLFNVLDVYNEFSKWQTFLYGKIKYQTKYQYRGIKKYLKEIKQNEIKLIQERNQSILRLSKLWLVYITSRILKNDCCFQIVSLFERAINVCYKSEFLWLNYVEFVLKSKLMSAPFVCQRSMKQ